MNEDYLPTPSALVIWTLGTGFLGGLASMILARRAEKAGWDKFKTGYMLAGIVAASALNLYLASRMQGE
jgi:hypothetical protein